jgi:hypothetical protein
MTEPPLLIIGGLSYLPVPNDQGVDTLSIKIYEGQSINLYGFDENGAYPSMVMTTYELNLDFEYQKTDPKTGKRYMLKSLRECHQVGPDLFIPTNINFSDNRTREYKVSEFELAIN